MSKSVRFLLPILLAGLFQSCLTTRSAQQNINVSDLIGMWELMGWSQENVVIPPREPARLVFKEDRTFIDQKKPDLIFTGSWDVKKEENGYHVVMTITGANFDLSEDIKGTIVKIRILELNQQTLRAETGKAGIVQLFFKNGGAPQR